MLKFVKYNQSIIDPSEFPTFQKYEEVAKFLKCSVAEFEQSTGTVLTSYSELDLNKEKN
jgi:hypothetical protein